MVSGARVRRAAWLIATLFVWGGCKDEGSADGDGSGSTGSDTSDPTSAESADESTGPPPSCVPGSRDCECLDGTCVGTLECIEGVCLPGPEIEVPGDFEVVAGVRVPIEIEVQADEFSWAQTGGPTATLEGIDATLLLVDVPADAASGEVLTFTVTAVQNTIERSAEVHVTVIEAVFEDFLAGIDDPQQLGTTEGLALGSGNMWVVSTEGFVSRFNSEGAFQNAFDLGEPHVGARLGRVPIGDDDDIDALLLANPASGRVEWMHLSTGDLTVITDQAEGGIPLGEVNYVLPAGNGRIFFTNRTGGQVFLHDLDDGVTRLFVEGLGTNPNALAVGPDQGYLYVGTVGKVHRVPVLPDGTAGDSEVYLDLGPDDDPTLEVDGLAFDEGANLWVGTPGTGTLHLARYRGSGATEVVRSFSDVGEDISGFVSLHWADGAFGRTYLYWTNLGGQTVGRLRVGLERL